MVGRIDGSDGRISLAGLFSATPPPHPHAASGRAVLAVASAGAAEEPPTTVRRRAPRALDDAGDLAGELLPDGVDQQHGAVAEDDLAVAVRPGGEAERGAGQALGDAVGDEVAVFRGYSTPGFSCATPPWTSSPP